MTNRLLLLCPALFAVAACNVERDAGNDTTTLSIDENKVEAGVDQAGNALKGAAGEVKDAARNAAPVLKEGARDLGNAAASAGRSVENGADRAAGEIGKETRDNPAPANRQ